MRCWAAESTLRTSKPDGSAHCVVPPKLNPHLLTIPAAFCQSPPPAWSDRYRTRVIPHCKDCRGRCRKAMLGVWGHPVLQALQSKVPESDTRSVGSSHIPSTAFRHLPPNSARFSYAAEGALFISAQLSSDAVSALRKVRGTNMTVEAT